MRLKYYTEIDFYLLEHANLTKNKTFLMRLFMYVKFDLVFAQISTFHGFHGNNCHVANMQLCIVIVENVVNENEHQNRGIFSSLLYSKQIDRFSKVQVMSLRRSVR